MDAFWSQIRHFKQSEFDSPDAKGSGANMQMRTVFLLEALRGLMGKSLRSNSGFRTASRNKQVGGAPASAHLTGEAVDVSTRGWTERERMDFIIYARKVGFTGIGIGLSFIHVDIKPRIASWRYSGGRTIVVPVGDEAKFV
ncbi:D-Ala-D-Ala carboxypeptidase family metallohydrolase [Sinorhizobium medicae]|uniref:D-Ala-D-Ala carboxypeptidase family metallohydrolase n=1 Tax=Sinorhizobium medicae TaxID=110321 RepID=UPI002AF6C643|nr:D-Ala-D-Ala carboxypeptidase family metallohydrolase [Sinorhizobium medicae]WQO60089.1 D-Ala-D-Ala carboxypeptidase family metallohydrolase [Sinorhizobium medicae]